MDRQRVETADESWQVTECAKQDYIIDSAHVAIFVCLLGYVPKILPKGL